MCNHHRWEANQSLKAALLRKGRPCQGTFQPGHKVAYFRARTATGDGEGSAKGYAPSTASRSGGVQIRTIWSLEKFGRDLQLQPRAFRHSDRPVPASDRKRAMVTTLWQERGKRAFCTSTGDSCAPEASRSDTPIVVPASDQRVLQQLEDSAPAALDDLTKHAVVDDPAKNAGNELSAPAPATPVAPEASEQQAPRPRPMFTPNSSGHHGSQGEGHVSRSRRFGCRQPSSARTGSSFRTFTSWAARTSSC